MIQNNNRIRLETNDRSMITIKIATTYILSLIIIISYAFPSWVWMTESAHGNMRLHPTCHHVTVGHRSSDHRSLGPQVTGAWEHAPGYIKKDYGSGLQRKSILQIIRYTTDDKLIKTYLIILAMRAPTFVLKLLLCGRMLPCADDFIPISIDYKDIGYPV